MPLVGTVDIAIWVTLRSILLDAAPHEPVPTNSGLFRAITIVAPEGCIANPMFPAPTIARFCGGNIIADTVMRALAPGAARARERRRRQPQGRRLLGLQRRAALGLHGHPGGQLRRPPRQGRARRRRHALREHAQQPDRGHRVALPPPRRRSTSCSRTAAAPGRWRGGLGSIARDRVPRRRRLLARGRRQRVGRRPGSSAAGTGTPGAVLLNRGTDGERAAAVEVPVPEGGGGRPALPDLAVRRRLRRSARARPRRRFARTSTTDT